MQTAGGVPVHGTYLQLTVREDRGTPRVVGSTFRLYRGAEVDGTATVDKDEAAGLSRQSLSLAASTEIVSQEMQVRDMDGVLELTWATALRGSHSRSIVIASGARAGQTTNVDERVFSSGTVSGFFVTGGAPGAAGVVTQAALANVSVSSATASTATDAAGAYTLDVPETDTIQASLNGRASDVFTEAGTPLTASGAAGPVLDLVLGSEAGGEAELAQATAYVFVDATRNFVEANGVPTEDLGEPLTTNTNIASTCNAFYSPFDRSINFFASGGGCNNSATDSVTAHEYGHFVDDAGLHPGRRPERGLGRRAFLLPARRARGRLRPVPGRGDPQLRERLPVPAGRQRRGPQPRPGLGRLHLACARRPDRQARRRRRRGAGPRPGHAVALVERGRHPGRGARGLPARRRRR